MPVVVSPSHSAHSMRAKNNKNIYSDLQIQKPTHPQNLNNSILEVPLSSCKGSPGIPKDNQGYFDIEELGRDDSPKGMSQSFRVPKKKKMESLKE